MVLALGLLTTVVLVDEVVAVVDLVVADNLPIVYVHMSTPILNCSTTPSNSIIKPCNYQLCMNTRNRSSTTLSRGGRGCCCGRTARHDRTSMYCICDNSVINSQRSIIWIDLSVLIIVNIGDNDAGVVVVALLCVVVLVGCVVYMFDEWVVILVGRLMVMVPTYDSHNRNRSRRINNDADCICRTWEGCKLDVSCCVIRKLSRS